MQMRRAGVLRKFRRVSSSVVALALAGSVASVALAAPAGAAPPGPHDPFGAVASTSSVSGGIRFVGWAANPDALKTNVTVAVIVDGRTNAASVLTSRANATVTSRYHTGSTPGFLITAPVASGAHTACVVALATGAGLHTVLKCVTTPLTSTLTSAQVAAHKPKGSITRASAGTASIRLQGWASDPDWISLRSTVVLYVDGRSTATVLTHAYAAPRPAAAGYRSAYDITVPVASGMHLGCMWVVNVGLASNTFLGCKALDTRGPAGSGALTIPAANKIAVAEAKKHIGQAYVWGATGPRTFDCSGLVVYSYGKAHITPPRVSEAQALKARLIPASRAVPGDLVFTHDTQGDVYHVGIYVSPGRTVAAIDENSGVNYQTIWDPSATTYGSLTHI